MSSEVNVMHERARERFSARVEGQDCELDYHLEDGVMTILHTGVPAQVGGRGIAAALTKAAFEWAREQGYKVRPACSYAAVFARRHPEYGEWVT